MSAAPSRPAAIARRDMIAAVLLGSVALAAPAVAAVVPSPWLMAMQRFEQARAAENTFDTQIWSPAYTLSDLDDLPIPAAIDDELTRLTELRSAAEEALIATPSPDLSAAIWKIEYARERWADFATWPDEWWQHVLMDLSRFAASTGGC